MEEPMNEHSTSSYVWLTERLDLPIVGPETAHGQMYTRAEWIVRGASDMSRVGVWDVGGITPAMKVVHLCESFRVRCEVHGGGAANLQVLLPDDPAFDMAVNLFAYEPGGHLPFVEVHVMEHGLIMLGGAGVYRLEDSWYPVQAGDVIWMAPYCAQWFVAMGKTPASYLYYKDVNRAAL